MDWTHHLNCGWWEWETDGTNLSISNFVIRKSNVKVPMESIGVYYLLRARTWKILREYFTKDIASSVDPNKKSLNLPRMRVTLYVYLSSVNSQMHLRKFASRCAYERLTLVTIGLLERKMKRYRRKNTRIIQITFFWDIANLYGVVLKYYNIFCHLCVCRCLFLILN